MLGDFQSMAQLAVGLNIGFAAFFSFFGESYDREKEKMESISRELAKLQKANCEIPKVDSAKYEEVVSSVQRHLDDARAALRRTGQGVLRSRYLSFTVSLVSALIAFMLLVQFSVKPNEPLSRCLTTLLCSCYFGVMFFLVYPALADIQLRRTIKDNLHLADELTTELSFWGN